MGRTRDDPIWNDLKTLRREDGVKDIAFVSETSPTNWRLIFYCYCLSTSFAGSWIAPSFFWLFSRANWKYQSSWGEIWDTSCTAPSSFQCDIIEMLTVSYNFRQAIWLKLAPCCEWGEFRGFIDKLSSNLTKPFQVHWLYMCIVEFNRRDVRT